MNVSAFMADGRVVEHKGTRYLVRLFDQDVKAAVELTFQGAVIRPFLAGQGERFERAVELVADRIAEGRYGFFSEFSRKRMGTVDGSLELAQALIVVHGGPEDGRAVTMNELLTLYRERGPELEAALRIVKRDSFPGGLIDEGPADPNSPRAAAPPSAPPPG